MTFDGPTPIAKAVEQSNYPPHIWIFFLLVNEGLKVVLESFSTIAFFSDNAIFETVLYTYESFSPKLFTGVPVAVLTKVLTKVTSWTYDI